jgi:hypothetical protein
MGEAFRLALKILSGQVLAGCRQGFFGEIKYSRNSFADLQDFQ